jgi:hypothetical protein
MRKVMWLFPASETVHFIGLTLLFGALMVVDLRLIGVITLPIRAALKFTHLAMAGFALNVISGIGCFASNPVNYYENPSFRWKMLLILLAGLNLAWFELVERRKVLSLPEGAATPLDTRVVAGISLLLWTGVIILGRFLPVTATGGG